MDGRLFKSFFHYLIEKGSHPRRACGTSVGQPPFRGIFVSMPIEPEKVPTT